MGDWTDCFLKDLNRPDEKEGSAKAKEAGKWQQQSNGFARQKALEGKREKGAFKMNVAGYLVKLLQVAIKLVSPPRETEGGVFLLLTRPLNG